MERVGGERWGMLSRSPSMPANIRFVLFRGHCASGPRSSNAGHRIDPLWLCGARFLFGAAMDCLEVAMGTGEMQLALPADIALALR